MARTNCVWQSRQLKDTEILGEIQLLGLPIYNHQYIQRSIAMPEYFRIKVGENGKTFVVDEDGNRIPPERHREIAAQITETVEEDAYVYVGYSRTKRLYKIGRSGDTNRRAKQLGIELIFDFKCEAWGIYSSAVLEKQLHSVFTKLHQHIEGEWFELDAIDLFALAYIIGDDSRDIPDVFGKFSALERIIDEGFQRATLVSPYHFLGRIYDFDWRTSAWSLYYVKTIAWHYMREPEGSWLGLLLYEIVLKHGLKEVMNRVFLDANGLAEGILENDLESILPEFERLGIKLNNEKGAN
jgi:hypothetical protein